ncbi:hypothetical protein N7492_009467 [Penicillium capsulatum]|uniref:Uncharacterized protein n=1 Tax=Penicillium capsulatum TaxID=69766 RepID=A0A9W9HX66_9EURO|nr:hypothetical protein N7492_009467 [Penicillium capsulatum]KAJ6106857.1 hypothetical protein N7512_010374 [Penicillium capsulatum]
MDGTLQSKPKQELVSAQSGVMINIPFSQGEREDLKGSKKVRGEDASRSRKRDSLRVLRNWTIILNHTPEVRYADYGDSVFQEIMARKNSENVSMFPASGKWVSPSGVQQNHSRAQNKANLYSGLNLRLSIPSRLLEGRDLETFQGAMPTAL